MVGTLPGRTQGLGLITEPLLRDLGLSRVTYAQINLVATLVGALFCLGVGRLIDRARQPHRADRDRRGARSHRARDEPGEHHGRRAGARDVDPRLWSERAVGRQPGDGGQVVPSALDRGDGCLRARDEHRVHGGISAGRRRCAIGRLACRVGVDRRWRSSACSHRWRGGWIDRRRKRSDQPWMAIRRRSRPGSTRRKRRLPGTIHATLGEALRSPAFWVFALASSVYGLVASGIGLLNESILAERGFAPDVYYTALAVTAITGLGRQFRGRSARSTRIAARHPGCRHWRCWPRGSRRSPTCPPGRR